MPLYGLLTIPGGRGNTKPDFEASASKEVTNRDERSARSDVHVGTVNSPGAVATGAGNPEWHKEIAPREYQIATMLTTGLLSVRWSPRPALHAVSVRFVTARIAAFR